MIKAVIFDYDDTLVQTMKSKWDAIRETGKRFYNLDITNDQIKKFWGQAYQEMLSGSLMNIDTFENLKKHYEETTKEFPMEAYPDALETIKKLLGEYKVGIVTASGKNLVIDDLTMLKFPVKKFFYIQTSEDTGVHKPDPKVFVPILQRLKAINIDQNDVIYIGDSTRDWLAARDAGIKFIGIAHGGSSTRDEFQKENSKILDHLSEIPEALISY